jgi:predicted kinase
MIKIILTKGIPACGKTTFAKELMAKEPGKWKRINFDELRATIDDGIYSPENEKIIVKVRDLLIKEALKNNQNVVLDNTHIKDKGRHFSHICDLVKNLGIDIQVIEKAIYVELEEAIARDAKRAVPVGETIIKSFWEASGGKQFKNYKTKVETFFAADKTAIKKAKFDPTKQSAILIDIDGTLASIGKRDVYDASRCDEVDDINVSVAETVKLYHKAGYKIIFCSGRDEKYRAPTVRFIEKHLSGVEYILFMRPDDDKRKDCLVKNDIFQREINGKYNVLFALDDRNQVVDYYRQELGLSVFQVDYGDF